MAADKVLLHSQDIDLLMDIRLCAAHIGKDAVSSDQGLKALKTGCICFHRGAQKNVVTSAKSFRDPVICFVNDILIQGIVQGGTAARMCDQTRVRVEEADRPCYRASYQSKADKSGRKV